MRSFGPNGRPNWRFDADPWESWVASPSPQVGRQSMGLIDDPHPSVTGHTSPGQRRLQACLAGAIDLPGRGSGA